MRTEPYDWFAPPGGQATGGHATGSERQDAPPYGTSQPYGPGITYGQSSAYGLGSAYGQPSPTGGAPTQPLPPLRVPTGEHQAQHARPAPGQHSAARAPTGEHPVRRPTGEHPVRRPTGQSPAVREIRSHAGPSGRRHGANVHRHGTELVVSRRTINAMRWILIPCALATVVALWLLWPSRPEAPPTGDLQRAYGSVQQVTEEPCPAEVLAGPCGTAVVRVDDGPGAGRDVSVDLPRGSGQPRLSVGDDVVLAVVPDPGGGPASYGFEDMQRGTDLLILVAVFALAVVAFGRLRGLTSLVGLAVCFAILLLFILPAILEGTAPLLVAIVGSAAIMFAVLYLTHGFTVHTSVAVLGTLASLALTGVLALLFTATTSLTGLADETALYITFLDADVDLRGLLLAGIIIGALGVLDDVTVTQSTAVAELARTATSRRELYRSAVRVGRAHVASAVNTIILAYAGASLPLLLLVSAAGVDLSDLLTGGMFAQEIVRAAVGTLGLVAAVPITTLLGALVADIRRDPREPRDQRPDGRAAPRPEPEHLAQAVAGR